MKSRLTVASITLLGMLGLILVGYLVDGSHEGKANAQRAVLRAGSQPPAPSSNNSPQFFVGSNQFQPPRFREPHRSLSVAATEPIVVSVKDGPQLDGEPVDLAMSQFETIFGPVAIPMNAIAGLRMAEDAREPVTICLTNGDSLTGVLATDSVTIKTSWGGATIGRDHIVSIATLTRPATWGQRNGRWTMIRSVETAPAEEGHEELHESEATAPADSRPQLKPGADPDTVPSL